MPVPLRIAAAAPGTSAGAAIVRGRSNAAAAMPTSPTPPPLLRSAVFRRRAPRHRPAARMATLRVPTRRLLRPRASEGGSDTVDRDEASSYETAAPSPSSSSSAPPVAPGSSSFEESDPARTPFHRRLARAARRRDPDAAESVLRDMASAGLLPGPRAVHACVVAAAAAGDADGALDAMRRAHAAGLRPLPESYVALIHAFAGVGDAAAARAVLASMARAVPDAREGWLALCAALFRAGLGDDAEAALLRGRRADGWQPDAEVYLEWIVFLCATRGARGAKLAQFIFSKDMRAAGVEPDIRHANVLLAADAFMLAPNVGERTLFAIADGAFGPLCRPNADSHAIVMEAHLEVIESAARKAARRLSGPDKETRMKLESSFNAASGGGASASAAAAASAEPDPVAAIFASDPANYTQRGLDEGSDGVGTGHDALDEALGAMLRAGIAPNRRVHAAMVRAKLLGGAGMHVVMGFFRRMVRLGGSSSSKRPGGKSNGKRTDLLPDETMAALVAALSDAAQPWDLLDVVAAAADDGRVLPEEVFGPRGLDAERLYLAEEEAAAYAAALEAAAEAAAEDDDEDYLEEDEDESGEGGFFGGEGGREERREQRKRQKEQQQLLPPRPSLSAGSFLSPIADWIPKSLMGAAASRVPGPGLVDFKAAAAGEEEEAGAEGWDLLGDDDDDDEGLAGGPSAAAAFASSASSFSPEGVLIETLLDAQGKEQRRVTLSASNAGSGSAADEGSGSSRHWVDADGAVVVAVAASAADPSSPSTKNNNVGPGAAATMVPISKMTRDQLVAELAARGLPFATMRKGEQYEAVKAARATDRAGGGGARDLDAVAMRRERAAMAAAAREAAKVSAAADESASAAAADVEWRVEVWEDGEVVEEVASLLAPPPWAKRPGDPDAAGVTRLPGSGLKDSEEEEEEEEEEETEESLVAEFLAELDHMPTRFSVHDGDDDEALLEMTAREVNDQAIARLASGVPDEKSEEEGLSYGFPHGPEDPFADPPASWPAGLRASDLGLRLLEAAEACGAAATAADLAALASAAAAERDRELALAVARRLGDGRPVREALSPPVVEAIGADLRKATRAFGGSGSGDENSSAARAAVEAALSAAGIGSHSHSRHPPAAALAAAAAAAAEAAEAAAETLEAAARAAAEAGENGGGGGEGDEEEDEEEARAREEAEAEEAEAVAAAIARAAAERAASPAPRLEGEVVRSPAAVAAAAAAAAASSSSRSSSSSAAAAPAAAAAAAADSSLSSASSLDDDDEEGGEGDELNEEELGGEDEEEEVVASAEEPLDDDEELEDEEEEGGGREADDDDDDDDGGDGDVGDDDDQFVEDE